MNACRSEAPHAFVILGQSPLYWETLDIKYSHEIASISGKEENLAASAATPLLQPIR